MGCIVTKFKDDSGGAAAYFMRQVFRSVAGNRNNGPELIEVMTKISDTRCYSLSMLERLDKLEHLMRKPSQEDEIADTITRVCRKWLGMAECHDLVVQELGS
jgi:hypothetical protein